MGFRVGGLLEKPKSSSRDHDSVFSPWCGDPHDRRKPISSEQYETSWMGVTKKHMVTPAILGNMWISVGYSADRVDGYRFAMNGYIGRVVFCLDGFSTNIYHIPHQRFFSLQGQGTTKIILTLALGQPYLHYPRGNMGETRPL